MRNVNTIIPGINIEKNFIPMLTDLLIHTTPLCMYTYDTCIATYSEEFYVKVDNKFSYDIVDMIVTDLYGKLKMDNKITLKFAYSVIDEDRYSHLIPLYVSYKDGSLIISNKVTFWNNIDGVNSYRYIPYMNAGALENN